MLLRAVNQFYVIYTIIIEISLYAGINRDDLEHSPGVKERMDQLEKRFVVHGGNLKKRGKRSNSDPY